jgi:hypothetical protein
LVRSPGHYLIWFSQSLAEIIPVMWGHWGLEMSQISWLLNAMLDLTPLLPTQSLSSLLP